jgi:hypothetical protein
MREPLLNKPIRDRAGHAKGVHAHTRSRHQKGKYVLVLASTVKASKFSAATNAYPPYAMLWRFQNGLTTVHPVSLVQP